ERRYLFLRHNLRRTRPLDTFTCQVISPVKFESPCLAHGKRKANALATARRKSPDQIINAIPIAIICDENRRSAPAEGQIHDSFLGRQSRYNLRVSLLGVSRHLVPRLIDPSVTDSHAAVCSVEGLCYDIFGICDCERDRQHRAKCSCLDLPAV